MAQKGLIYSSIEGKGIYTTDESKAKANDDSDNETDERDGLLEDLLEAQI